MKVLNNRIICLLFIFFIIIPVSSAIADDTMILVVNPADQSKSQQFIDYLTANDISVEYCTPTAFDSVKADTYIAIVGGVDDEAVRKLVSEAVGEEEAALLNKSGTGKMYYKEGIWAPGQKLLIFAGSDSNAAVEARKAARATWMSYIEEWFELEGPGAEVLLNFSGAIAPECTMISSGRATQWGIMHRGLNRTCLEARP